MKIGVYGGSFDPIHIGHLSLAIEIMEAHSLDQVWFCPAFISPYKMNGRRMSANHRLEMLRLALQDEPRFRIVENELKRQGPSYTIDTLRELIGSESNSCSPRFFLILGEDAAQQLPFWREPEEIVKLVPLLVGSRIALPSKNAEGNAVNPVIQQAIQKGMTRTRINEMSSSEIRDRLSKKQYCGHLLHLKVLDYIHLHHLYLSADYEKTR